MSGTQVCPYCAVRQSSRDGLRVHIARNTCGQVPADVSVAYVGDEAKINEDDFRKRVELYARELGWLVNHVERARGRDGRWITPCSPGFPDSMFVRSGRILVVEFKKTGAPRPTDAQVEWLEAFAQVPFVEVRVWRPADWPGIQRELNGG